MKPIYVSAFNHVDNSCEKFKTAVFDLRNSEIIDDEERHKLGLMMFDIVKYQYIIRGLLEAEEYDDHIHEKFLDCQYKLAFLEREYRNFAEV